MNTKILLPIIVFLILISLDANAQSQPPNAGFENWTEKTTNELNGFFTSNSSVIGDSGNVTKITDAQHGSFAAKLTTVLSGNNIVPGMLLIGTAGGSQGIGGGKPYSGTPDSVAVYVKYNIKPNDTAYFIVGFKQNGTFVAAPVIFTFTGIQSNYTRFSFPTYLDPFNPPDSFVAIITSSNLNTTQIVGSTLTIDNIGFQNSAQTFPNGDFENWTPVISNKNPAGWSSFNNFTSYGIPEMSFKTPDAHSGSFALRLVSVTATIPPPFGTGVLDTMAGFVFLGGTDLNQPGAPYADRPIAMRAFVKGTIMAGGQAYLVATLSKWNPNTQSRDQVGSAVYFTSSSVANYTLISIPFNYSLPVNPDTLDFKIMAGNMGPGGTIMPGNDFFVDDLSFSFSTGLNASGKDNLTVTIFPNPATDKVNIYSPEKIDVVDIYNLLGEKVSSTNNFKEQVSNEIELSSFPKGIYYLKVYSGEKFHIEKIVIR